MSPGDYLSSDGGSGFQLMKTDGDTEKPREGREGKKRSRKYRGATEEILAGWVRGVCECVLCGEALICTSMLKGPRFSPFYLKVLDKHPFSLLYIRVLVTTNTNVAEREKEREKRGRRKETKRYRAEEEERGSKKSNRGSPYRGGGEGGRGRGREEQNLYARSDDWHHPRDYRRGDGRRGNEGRRDTYRQQRREESLEDVRRRGRLEEGGRRFSVSPRPGKSDWRGGLSRKEDREREGERRERSEHGEERMRYERGRIERKQLRKRKRSREEQLEERERERREEREGSSESEEESSEKVSPGDKIDDLIKDLEELDESREGERRVSSSDDEEREDSKEREGSERSGVSDSERSEEGEIADENVSSDDGEEETRGRESRHELTRSATEPVMRSKFDSSENSSDEDDDDETRQRKKSKRGAVSYSGYSEVVSGSEHSDVETHDTVQPIEAEVKEEEKQSADENEGRGEVEKQEEEQEEEEEREQLPSYVPGLMGCRNVEEYEWLNRIEEGTYGVVYRARDKRTGTFFLVSFVQ